MSHKKELSFELPEVDDIIMVKEWVEPHNKVTLLIMKVKRIIHPCFVLCDFVRVFTDGKVQKSGGNIDLRVALSIEYSTDERFEMLQNLYKNDSTST
jgi:hypothetical protein